MFLNIAILAVTALTALALARPKLHANKRWSAMITPLASIIGSGFLVLGPILDHRFGAYAPLAMAALCAVGWLFGAAIRANILTETAPDTRLTQSIERASELTLAFAYVISVAYYLNLFGAFAVSLTPWDGNFSAKLVTTAALLLVAFAGQTGGFKALERMEYFTVSLKLAIIAGLIFGLAQYFGKQALTGALIVTPPSLTGWDAARLMFGLIVTVQGFETARYLGATYKAETRVAAMKQAQWVSSAIYMIYIGLLAWLFAPDPSALTETAIIDMMQVVAPILPLLLVAAALSAQFSAAVADTGGAGGLISELSGGKIKPRPAYILLVALGVGLTWAADLFAIIAYASRAFAAYYALQSALAAVRETGAKRIGFAALAALGAMMAVLGVSAEG